MEKSKFLSLNARDFLKGLFLVVITSIVTGIYELIQNGTVFTWETIKPVLMVAAGTGLSYLIKNLLTNSQGEMLTTEKSPLVLSVQNAKTKF